MRASRFQNNAAIRKNNQSASCSSIIAENLSQRNGALVEFSASKFNHWLTAKISNYLSAKGGSPPPLFSPPPFNHAIYPSPFSPPFFIHAVYSSPFSPSLFAHPLIHSLSRNALSDGSVYCVVVMKKQHHHHLFYHLHFHLHSH